MFDQCESRHTQLFYIIKLYEIFWATQQFLGKDLLAVTSPALVANRKTLEEAQVFYQVCGQELDKESFLRDFRQQFTVLEASNRKIKQLELELVSLKQLVWENDLTPWESKKLARFTAGLSYLETLFNQIKACDKKDDMDLHYEAFMQKLFFVQRVLLRLHLRTKYFLARQLGEQIFLLTKWQEIITKFKQSLTTQYSSANNVFFAIAVEEKLGNEKYRFNQSFFTEVKQHRDLLSSELFLSLLQAKDVDLVEFLQVNKTTLKKAVREIEDSLTTNYGEIRLLAKLVSCWRHSNHYGYASSVFHMADEITQHRLIQNIPIANERLWPGTTLFLTNVLALAGLSLDLYASQYVGVSYTLISSISELLILQIASYEDFFESIGEHPKALATEVLPILRELLNLGIYLFIQGMVSGFSKPGLSLAVGAYFAGLLLQKMVTALIYRYFNPDTSNAYTIGFVAMITNYLSFSVGAQLWYAGANLAHKKWLQPKSDYILFNDRECMANLNDCCARAEEVLTNHTLSNTQVSQGKLKSQLRHFLLGHHPDKTNDPDKIATYYQVNAALQIVEHKCVKN